MRTSTGAGNKLTRPPLDSLSSGGSDTRLEVQHYCFTVRKPCLLLYRFKTLLSYLVPNLCTDSVRSTDWRKQESFKSFPGQFVMDRAVVFELPGFKTPLNTETLWGVSAYRFFLSVTRVEPRRASHFIYRSQTSPGFTSLSGRVQGTYCLVL